MRELKNGETQVNSYYKLILKLAYAKIEEIFLNCVDKEEVVIFRIIREIAAGVSYYEEYDEYIF